jgi:hypothetical protein
MGGRLLRVGLASLLLGGVTIGCTKPAVQHKEPPDPLLVTKKPVEGRPRPLEADNTRTEVPFTPRPGIHLVFPLWPPADREASPVKARHEEPAPVPPALTGIEPVADRGGR